MWDKIKAYVRGAFKSKTMWFSGLIGGLGALNDNSQYLHAMLDDVSFNELMIAISLAIAFLRILTTTSLDAK
jgi:hypothetical protein